MEDLQVLLEQEQQLRCKGFDSASAWELGSWIVGKALAEALPIAVDITIGGRCLFHWSSNGAIIDNAFWIERKKRSVMRFAHSSLYLGRRLAKEGRTAYEKHYVDEADYGFHGGSFPIFVEGTGLVGAVTVSGLKQEDDHDLVVEALAVMLGRLSSVPRLQ